MNRFVRVVLSASVEQFNRNIRGAQRLFRGFIGAVTEGAGGAVSALVELGRGVFFLREGLRTATAIAKGLFDTFLQGAIDTERQQVAFEVLTEDAQKAQEMINFLREEAKETGNDFDGLSASAQQVAVALRGAQGEVDLETWRGLVKQVEAFQALRPDVPVQLWGRAISSFLAGDPMTLTRLLDVNVRQLGQLSEDAKAFLGRVSEAGDKQLGQVTRLVGGVEQDAEGALDALAEVAEAVGATEELTERLADTTGGKLAQSQEEMKDKLREIGLELLPAVNEALDKFLELIRSEDFDRFVDAFADFAVGGLEQLIQLLESTDASQIGNVLQAMAEALNSVNWEAVANSIREINQFLSTPIESPILDALTTGPQEAGEAVGEALGTGGREGGIFGQGGAIQKAQQGVREFLGVPEEGLRLGPQKVEVEVIASVDDEGQMKVKQVAQRAAQRELGEFIDGVTRD